MLDKLVNPIFADISFKTFIVTLNDTNPSFTILNDIGTLILVKNNTTTNQGIINLPDISAFPSSQRLIIIKDIAGNAATRTIQVNAVTSQTIEGNTSFTINSNYGFVILQSYFDGTYSWAIIGKG